MKLTPFAQELLSKRYVARDAEGNALETPEQVFERVADCVASAEDESVRPLWREKFLTMMTDNKFMPNSPTLMNANRPLGQLSACFVLPVEDSMEGIFEAVKQAAVIHKSGGGTGFSFSRLRGKHSFVASTGGTASGPLSFMQVFNVATDTVKQGGKRRGANMGVLRVDHPDIMDFIVCKADGESFTNFNLSIGITDAFMAALEGNTPFSDLAAEDGHLYYLIDPHTGMKTDSKDAREVFKAIVHNAWSLGDPGLIFIDRVNSQQPDVGTPIEATNPCVTGDTPVYFAPADWDGRNYGSGKWEPIQNLVGKDICVWNGECWSKVTPFKQAEAQTTSTVEFSNGGFVSATADHRWPIMSDPNYVWNPGDSLDVCRVWKTTAELKPGMVLVPWFRPMVPDEDSAQFWHPIRVFVDSINLDPGTHDVYCLTEPRRHCFVAGMVITGNCGEQPLLPYESCNLGSINLSAFHAGGKNIDLQGLKETVYTAVRFLDNVITVNKYPLDEIGETTRKYRKIGLGVMGWADLLIKLGIPYGSPESFEVAKRVMQFINCEALVSSTILAATRGAFPAWEEIRDEMSKHYTEEPIRNMMRTTIAPTGTISMIAGVSSGIEPIFSYAYVRKIVGMDDQLMVSAPLAEILAKHSEEDAKRIVDYICETGDAMHCPYLDEKYRGLLVSARDLTPEQHIKMQAAFQQHTDNAISKTINMDNSATEADVEEAYMQAWSTGCKGITIYRDGSRGSQVLNIGKTASGAVVPVYSCNHSTVDIDSYEKMLKHSDIKSDNALEQAWAVVMQLWQRVGNNSRTWPEGTVHDKFLVLLNEYPEFEPVLYMFNEDAGIKDANVLLAWVDGNRNVKPEFMVPRKRSKSLWGRTTCMNTGCGKLYVTINADDQGICEIFTSTGKGGGCPSQSEASARLASIALRAGISVEEIVSQLRGIRCPSALKRADSECTSCPDAIAKLLLGFQAERHGKVVAPEVVDHKNITSAFEAASISQEVGGIPETDICPECGTQLSHQGGCLNCLNCGWSKCN